MNKPFMFSSKEEFNQYLIKRARNQAIREFAERLKDKKHICLPPDGYPIDENDWVIYEDDIDDVVKEMEVVNDTV